MEYVYSSSAHKGVLEESRMENSSKYCGDQDINSRVSVEPKDFRFESTYIDRELSSELSSDSPLSAMITIYVFSLN